MPDNKKQPQASQDEAKMKRPQQPVAPMPNSTIDVAAREELRLSRSTVRATWVAALAALLSLPIAIFSLGYTVWSAQKSAKEDIVFTASRWRADYPSQLKDTTELSTTTVLNASGTIEPTGVEVKTGLVSVYFSLLISNNSDKNISLNYNVESRDDPVWNPGYSDLDQGSYVRTDSGSLSPLQFPITLEPGTSKKLYIKLGLMMSSTAYKLAKEKYRTGNVTSIKELDTYLASSGVNVPELAFSGGSFDTGNIAYGSPEVEKEVYNFVFTTGKGTKFYVPVSWYGSF